MMSLAHAIHRRGYSFMKRGILMAVLAVGCGKSGEQLADVEGVVLLDGRPLANATVEFQPAGPASKGRPSIGETGVDGRYKLRFSKVRWGAIVGRHKVLVTTFSPTGDGKFKERVPDVYNTNTSLLRDVEQSSNWLDFNLQSNAGPQTLASGE